MAAIFRRCGPAPRMARRVVRSWRAAAPVNRAERDCQGRLLHGGNPSVVTPSPVAFLIEYYRPFEVGGAERSAAALAAALAERGARVVVMTPRYGRVAQDEQAAEIVQLPFPQRLEPGQLARRI